MLPDEESPLPTNIPDANVLKNEAIVPDKDELVPTSEMKSPPQSTPVSRPRNYSFKHKRVETLDVVEVGSEKYSVPAHMGSTYWAILKTMYESVNKPVYIPALIARVSELMLDRNEDTWKLYLAKTQTTVYRKGEGKRSVQAAKPWQERLVNNAKTLTRLGGNSKYGQRLYEIGHMLSFRHDGSMQPYFILETSLKSLAPKVSAK